MKVVYDYEFGDTCIIGARITIFKDESGYDIVWRLDGGVSPNLVPTEPIVSVKTYKLIDMSIDVDPVEWITMTEEILARVNQSKKEEVEEWMSSKILHYRIAKPNIHNPPETLFKFV